MNRTRSIVAFLIAVVFAAAAYVPQQAEAAGRRLVPNDVVQIKVVNQPELDTQSRIAPDGTLAFPYVGRIRASGMTEDQLASTIRNALERADVVKRGQVLVSVLSFGGQASVQGAVGAPGAISLERNTTLAEALSKVGGISLNSGMVVITRRAARGTTTIRFNGKDVVAGRRGAEFLLQPDDQIYVEQAPVYYLYGYVGKPGEYPLVRSLTVQQALAMGGGIMEMGSESRLRIKRRVDDGSIVEIPVTLDEPVQPNDMIIVKERWF